MAFNSKKSHSIVLFNICLSIFLACISFAPTKVVAQRTDTLAISPNDDASISNRSDMVNSNFVNTPFQRLSGWTGNNVGSNEQDWRALIKVPSLTNFQGKTIIKATLLLHHDNRYPYQEIGDFSFKLYPLTADWNSGTVTWNSQPGYDAQLGIDVPARSQLSHYDTLSINLTPLVQSIASNQKANYGFILKLNNENPYNSINFASADNDSAKLRPILILKYNDNHGCDTWQPDSSGIDAAINNRNDQVNLNFGNSSYLQVVGWSGNNVGSPQQNMRSLIKFKSLDDLGSNIAIDSAFLTLYFPTDYPFSLPITQDNSGKLYLIKDSWSENTVTWNNQPRIDSTIFIPTPNVASYDSIRLNITTLVKSIVENGRPNHGFMYKINNETPYHSVYFASSDHPQRAWRPKLKVCKRNATSIPTYSSDASTTFVEEIQLFPNPATSEHVEVVSSIPFSSVKVYAIDGMLMFTSNEKLININIQNYLPGIYTAVFITNAGTKIKKFIKY